MITEIKNIPGVDSTSLEPGRLAGSLSFDDSMQFWKENGHTFKQIVDLEAEYWYENYLKRCSLLGYDYDEEAIMEDARGYIYDAVEWYLKAVETNVGLQ